MRKLEKHLESAALVLTHAVDLAHLMFPSFSPDYSARDTLIVFWSKIP